MNELQSSLGFFFSIMQAIYKTQFSIHVFITIVDTLQSVA